MLMHNKRGYKVCLVAVQVALLKEELYKCLVTYLFYASTRGIRCNDCQYH